MVQYNTDDLTLQASNIPAPRFLGADVSGSPGSTIKPGQLPDPNSNALAPLEQGGKYLQGATSYEQQSNQARYNSVKSAQQAVGDTISGAAQSALDIAKAKAAGAQNNTGFETLVGAVGTYIKLKKQEEAQGIAAERSKQYLSAFQEVQDLKVKWRENGLDNEGVTSYTSALKSALTRYPGLDAEQIQKLTDDGYSIAVQYATEKSHAQQAYFKDLRDKQADTASAGLQLELNGELAKLQTDIYQDSKPVMEGITAKIAQWLDNPNMDRLTAAIGVNTALKATLGAMDKHNIAYQDLQVTVRAIDQYASYAINMTQEVENGSKSPQEASALLQRKRLELGVPTGYQDPTPFQSERLTQEHLSIREGINSLTEKGAIREAEKAQMDSASISFLAWGIINNPDTIALVKANKQFSAIPGVQTAIQLAEDFTKGEKERNKLNLDMQGTREQLAQAQRGDIQWFIGQANSGGSNSVNEILQIQLGIQLPKVEGGKLTPEQAQQYQAASGAYQNELINRLNIQQQQYNQSQSTLSRYGLVGDRAAIGTRMNSFKVKYDSFVNTFGQNSGNTPDNKSTKGASTPFSQGSVRKATRPATFSTINFNGKKTILPFSPDAQVHINDNYKQDRGTHLHAGEDISVPEGTKVQSPVNGKVLKIQDDGNEGYGQYIDVLGDDGKLYRYAHLTRKGTYVQEGQRVDAGDILAKSGNTGHSNGAHLHFEIRDPNKPYGFDGTLDPLNYLASQGVNFTQSQKPRTFNDGSWHSSSVNNSGASSLSSRIPSNAIALPGGQYILNNKVHNISVNPAQSPKVTQVYSNGSPLRNGASSNDRSTYGKNKPGASYGYAALANDRDFSNSVARVSDRLGIPAQWLADLMAFETGGSFNPAITNGLGCTGLIQFCPSGGQAEIGKNSSELSNMSRSEQMEHVYTYLKKFGSDLHKGSEWVLASVWGGQGLINAMNKRGVAAVAADPSWNDGDITFGKYMKRLGEHAGRSYAGGASRVHKMENRIHTSFKGNCKMCIAIRNSNSAFIPHEKS